jgi:ABC-type Fe3+-hydroxamate transport system substrate-binding protein
VGLPILTGQTTKFVTAAQVDAEVSASLAAGQSLYTLDTELLKRLRPDVILTQDLCSVCAIDLATVERVAASMDPPPRVVSLNPLCLDDVLLNVLEVGRAVGMETEAEKAYAGLAARIAAVDMIVAAQSSRPALSMPNVAFLEWSDPIYVGGHWTPELIERAGGTHPLNPTAGRRGAGRSFSVDPSVVAESDPDLVVLCCCGLDLASTRREADNLSRAAWWNSLRAVREGNVAMVDGDAMFNRPGPRLVDALEWLTATIHSRRALMPRTFPVEWLRPHCEEARKEPRSSARAGPTRNACAVDIEELHRSAVRAGKRHYTDPVTGYHVFTQLASIDRGVCCGNGCRHCAFGHENVAKDRRVRLAPPIVINESEQNASSKSR